MKILRSFLLDTKINFMKVHKIALFLSIASIIASIALVAVKGLNFGIDFSGGVLMEVRIENADVKKVREVFEGQIKDVQIQNVDSDFLIRVAKNSQSLENKDGGQQILIDNIKNILEKNFNQVSYRKIDFVGPQVGAELIMKGFMALILSFVCIMIYIWIRFDWQFGAGGIFALLHDTALLLGFFSLSGLEFNLTSIAAILTVIGYSINDSVVIYDRIRENLRVMKKADLADVINSSLNSTMSRTFLTSITTLFSLLAFILFGGEVLKSFSVATFVGILIGTYSSVYISAPILLYFDPRKKDEDKKRLL